MAAGLWRAWGEKKKKCLPVRAVLSAGSIKNREGSDSEISCLRPVGNRQGNFLSGTWNHPLKSLLFSLFLPITSVHSMAGISSWVVGLTGRFFNLLPEAD